MPRTHQAVLGCLPRSGGMLATIVVSDQFYAGWGTLSLVNAGIAQGKGRSGLNWFLLSLVGGPIATLALVALFDHLPAR